MSAATKAFRSAIASQWWQPGSRSLPVASAGAGKQPPAVTMVGCGRVEVAGWAGDDRQRRGEVNARKIPTHKNTHDISQNIKKLNYRKCVRGVLGEVISFFKKIKDVEVIYRIILEMLVHLVVYPPTYFVQEQWSRKLTVTG